MSTVVTQDIFGFPVATGVQVTVPGAVTNISGSGPTAQITVQPVAGGNTGDTSNTIVVGPKQLNSPTHPTGTTQLVFGQYLDIVGRTANLRGTVQSISGSGPTAQITVSVTNNNNLGDTSNTIVVGPKQVQVVTGQ